MLLSICNPGLPAVRYMKKCVLFLTNVYLFLKIYNRFNVFNIKYASTVTFSKIFYSLHIYILMDPSEFFYASLLRFIIIN